MSRKTITESFQMRKNIIRGEEKCTKRRLIDSNYDSNNTAVEDKTNQITKGAGTKLHNVDKNNSKNPVADVSPIFQSQKDIAWNTISPDCFRRLKHRVLDDAKIHENVETTLKSYMFIGTKPKKPKNEFLDNWLSKTENILSHPTTPKISKTVSRRNICKQSSEKILEAKRMLEKSNLKFSLMENKPETSKKEENVTDKKENSFDELWEEDELFNDSDFLASTQQFEEKYRQNKPDTETATSSNLGDPETLEIYKATKVPDHCQTIEKSVITNEHSNEQNESWLGEEFDEIDKFMCTVDVPQSQTASDDIPTQVFNPESLKKLDAHTREKILNNSFDFDSDDSFGADFQM